MPEGTNLADIGTLVQSVGTLGVLVIALFSGFKGAWVWGSVWKQSLEAAKRSTELESVRADRAEAKLERLQTIFEDKVLPVLEASNHVQAEAIIHLASSRDKIEQLIRESTNLAREVSELKGSRR